uniref:Uncharacterized protein n=1 Tax=Nelumbo nucifera TaxID=4432 RepID=A0A822Z0I8_NELNU|nr:TPA_asm: hypothetical protein HUJ06_007650 [Nelumbo nucifera]
MSRRNGNDVWGVERNGEERDFLPPLLCSSSQGRETMYSNSSSLSFYLIEENGRTGEGDARKRREAGGLEVGEAAAAAAVCRRIEEDEQCPFQLISAIWSADADGK